jgi:disulfide bond formation protein DsbB
MLTDRLGVFFAILSFAAAAGTVIVVGMAALQRFSDSVFAARFFAELRPVALWLAWLVAAVTMTGSLYYSLGAHFHPCPLCWFQRVCVYPFAVMLLIAALKKDDRVWRYVLPMASIGVVLAAYHAQLQAFPDQGGFCNLRDPCLNTDVNTFGFVTLPLMDLTALLLIITLTLVARSKRPEPEEIDG